MIMKKYSSFKEIDRELEILLIETQLQKIKLSQSANRTLNSLSPINLITEALGSYSTYLPSTGIIQQFIIMLITKKFFK
jgi:nicotinamide riboside transporter PnuC